MPRRTTAPETPLTEAQQALVNGAVRFARREASRQARKMQRDRGHLNYSEVFESMASAAVEGLCIAARKFKPELGWTFLTYANAWIYQRMQDEFRQWHPLSPNFVERGRRRRVRNEEADAARIVRAGDDGFGEPPVCDDAVYDGDAVAALLRSLPAKERAVVRLCVLGGLALRDAGERLGVSRERVRQIRDRALNKLAMNPLALRLAKEMRG